MTTLSGKSTIKLTDEMIETQAQMDLIAHQRASRQALSFPIYPEEIAKALWGTEIIFEDSVQDPEGKEVFACFVPSENRIYFNTTLKCSEGQGSFTLAHEVGHASLHNFLNKISNVKVMCRGSQTLPIKEKKIEAQADKYAAFLLMPTLAVMDKLSSLGIKSGDKVNLSEVSAELRSHFGVSLHALENRLIEMGFTLENAAYSHAKKKFFDSDYTPEADREKWMSKRR